MPGQTLPDHRECASTTKKKKTSGTKKLRDHPQLKQQERTPKAVNNETDLCSLTDLEFQKGDGDDTEGIKRRHEQ